MLLTDSLRSTVVFEDQRSARIQQAVAAPAPAAVAETAPLHIITSGRPPRNADAQTERSPSVLDWSRHHLDNIFK